MTDVIIYHNARCSKSRAALKLLRERGIEPRIVEYLKEPPDEDELSRILGMLGMGPQELIRTGEDAYLEFDVATKKNNPRELIREMIAHPILIERPIVVCGNKARIGRPPENILEILG
jgi:arsenate reductase